MKDTIFSELEGFVIYEPYRIEKFLQINEIKDKNLLNYLTTSELGDTITEEGIAVPITWVPPDDYKFSILDSMPESYLARSEGWVFKVENGSFSIMGIGYLTNIDRINNKDVNLSFNLENSWYSLTIVSYMEEEQKCFGLILEKEDYKPDFYGDLEMDFLFS